MAKAGVAAGRATLRRAVLGLVLAILVGSTASPAAAWSLVGQTGTVGGYDFADDSGTDFGAKCGYEEVTEDHDWLRWMRVKPPTVYAYDRNAQRNRQIVGWVVRLQKARSETDPWVTVKSSSEQRETAYDDMAAPFTARKLFAQAAGPAALWRSLVIIRWYRAGEVEGTAKARIEWYRYQAANAAPDHTEFGSCQNLTD